MIDASDKEVPFPSARYYSAVTEILGELRGDQISEMEAVKRIALIEPDCGFDDCCEPVSLPTCDGCDHIMHLEG